MKRGYTGYMLLGRLFVPRDFVDFINGEVDVRTCCVVLFDKTPELFIFTRLKRPGDWWLSFINCRDVTGQRGVVAFGEVNRLVKVRLGVVELLIALPSICMDGNRRFDFAYTHITARTEWRIVWDQAARHSASKRVFANSH